MILYDVTKSILVYLVKEIKLSQFIGCSVIR